MTTLTKDEIKKMNTQELQNKIAECKKMLVSELMKLRGSQSNEQKFYKQNKKLIAQIYTELNSRTEATNN